MRGHSKGVDAGNPADLRGFRLSGIVHPSLPVAISSLPAPGIAHNPALPHIRDGATAPTLPFRLAPGAVEAAAGFPRPPPSWLSPRAALNGPQGIVRLPVRAAVAVERAAPSRKASRYRHGRARQRRGPRRRSPPGVAVDDLHDGFGVERQPQQDPADHEKQQCSKEVHRPVPWRARSRRGYRTSGCALADVADGARSSRRDRPTAAGRSAWTLALHQAHLALRPPHGLAQLLRADLEEDLPGRHAPRELEADAVRACQIFRRSARAAPPGLQGGVRPATRAASPPPGTPAGPRTDRAIPAAAAARPTSGCLRGSPSPAS